MLGGDRRPDGGAPGRGDVGRRPQPPVARPRRPRHRRGPARRDVRGRGLAHGDGQVRPAARPAAGPARPHRRDAQRGVPAAAARRRARPAPPARGADATTSATRTCSPPSATSAATTCAGLIDGYRQADAVNDRPSVVFAYTIKGWSLPTEGHPANHSALLNHAQYRELADQAGRGRRRPVPAARRRRGPSCAGRSASGSGASRRRAVPAPTLPPDLGRKHTGTASTQQAFGRFFVDLTREAPEVADRVVTVSPDVGTSTNLGGWINKAGIWNPRRPDRLVRRRHGHARALARVRPRPPHRARHRRGQPRRPARRARRHLVPRRPAAAAGRHDLRPVREPRAGAVVVRHLRRRPVDPRRHAVRRHARPRGRRAPVGDHAHRSASSSRAASRTSRRSARTSSGASCTRSPSSASRAARQRLLPALHAPDRPVRCTRARGRRRSPAATGSSASSARG